MKSEIRNQKPKVGFTLVELLVVVTIIVVLLALLVPAMDKAVEAAQRAKCASQLRNIHSASYFYTQENRGVFFVCRFRVAPHGFNALEQTGQSVSDNDARSRHPQDNTVDWIEAIATVGLTVGPQKSATSTSGTTPGLALKYRDPAPVWNCPSSTKPKSAFSTKFHALAVQYQFWGGIDKWDSPLDGQRDSRSPLKLSRSHGSWVLVNDFNQKPGGWAANHADYPDEYPAGGNQAHVDGSVIWSGFEQLAFIHSYNNSPVLSWQSDLGEGGLSEGARAKYWK